MKVNPEELKEWLRWAMIYAQNTSRPKSVEKIREFIDRIEKETKGLND